MGKLNRGDTTPLSEGKMVLENTEVHSALCKGKFCTLKFTERKHGNTRKFFWGGVLGER